MWWNTVISEDLAASICRGNFTLKMKAARSSETLKY
jgi:hypothetical protein